MNTNLKDFYSLEKELIEKSEEARKRSESLLPFTGSALGAPIILKDEIALKLAYFNLVENTHFVPGHKPALGIGAGDYIDHENKKYIYGMHISAICNYTSLHLIRPYEFLIKEWEGIKDKVKADLKNVLDLISPENPIYLSENKLTIENFEDYVGFNHINTPSPEYLKRLKELADIYKTSKIPNCVKFSKDISKIIRVCKKFSVIGQVMEKIRDVTDSKGHAIFDDDVIRLSSPAVSGGISWIQYASSNILDAVPNGSNLVFFASQANKLTTNNIGWIDGVGSTPEKSITFITLPGIVQKIQAIVDNSLELKESWKTCEVKTTDDVDSVFKVASGWCTLVEEIIKEDLFKFLQEMISENVIGIQADLTNPDNQIHLRPIITESCVAANSDFTSSPEFTEKYSTPEKMELEDFLCDGGKGYYLLNLPKVTALSEATASAEAK